MKAGADYELSFLNPVGRYPNTNDCTGTPEQPSMSPLISWIPFPGTNGIAMAWKKQVVL